MREFFVHTSAIVDTGCTIGAGTRIWHFSHVMSGARIGKDCVLGQGVYVAARALVGDGVKIQNNVSLYDGTTVENEVFLGPSCVITNITNPRASLCRKSMYEETLIRFGATIGANATIVSGVAIGRHAFIAAGAVVAEDVDDYALICGVPGKRGAWMSRHGHKLTFASGAQERCKGSGLLYERKASGEVICCDLPEDEKLPDELRTELVPYRFSSQDGS